MIKALVFGVLVWPSVIYGQFLTSKPDTGIASYYSDKFEGRRTANGDIFRQDSLTAAHKTLPFGTRVKVTLLKNKQSVIVTINDRGMGGKKRVIDLSKAAARQIGLTHQGLGKVSVEVLYE